MKFSATWWGTPVICGVGGGIWLLILGEWAGLFMILVGLPFIRPMLNARRRDGHW